MFDSRTIRRNKQTLRVGTELLEEFIECPAPSSYMSRILKSISNLSSTMMITAAKTMWFRKTEVPVEIKFRSIIKLIHLPLAFAVSVVIIAGGEGLLLFCSA